MTQNNGTAVARQPQQQVTLKSLLRDPAWQKRFEDILGKRSAQFVSSVMSVGNSLGPDCEPTSIIASAMTAATLDLPVDKNLGFAWIVPYKAGGKKLAQFQMGYKGYIQLGLRTGQYERMNARVINAEAFQGWDEVGEPIIDWAQVDESKPSVGYVFAFKLVNGFTKIAYWPKERVEEHAKRFSKSYGGNYDSPWKSNFDPMALKTVIKNELAKWGILSIEMQKAIQHDQATQESLDSEPQYIDGTDIGHAEEAAAKPEPVAVITEDQRIALITAAATGGLSLQLPEIIGRHGFEMVAHITVDKYDEIFGEIVKQPSVPGEDEQFVEGQVVTDEAPIDEAEAPPADPLEQLRVNVQSALEELPKSRQKDLLAGKTPINKADADDLTALTVAIREASA